MKMGAFLFFPKLKNRNVPIFRTAPAQISYNGVTISIRSYA
jgi:hypothetical protein